MLAHRDIRECSEGRVAAQTEQAVPRSGEQPGSCVSGHHLS
jgi:hypothetical protein